MSFGIRDISRLSALRGTNLVLFCVGAVCVTALIVTGKLDMTKAAMALGGLATWLTPSPLIETTPPPPPPTAKVPDAPK